MPGQESNILRYHPAWCFRTHSTHTRWYAALCLRRSSLRLTYSAQRFCLPSEAHSELFFIPRSQHPRLSEIKRIKPTHSSSSVFVFIKYHHKNRLSSIFYNFFRFFWRLYIKNMGAYISVYRMIGCSEENTISVFLRKQKFCQKSSESAA